MTVGMSNAASTVDCPDSSHTHASMSERQDILESSDETRRERVRRRLDGKIDETTIPSRMPQGSQSRNHGEKCDEHKRILQRRLAPVVTDVYAPNSSATSVASM